MTRVSLKVGQKVQIGSQQGRRLLERLSPGINVAGWPTTETPTARRHLI